MFFNGGREMKGGSDVDALVARVNALESEFKELNQKLRDSEVARRTLRNATVFVTVLGGILGAFLYERIDESYTKMQSLSTLQTSAETQADILQSQIVTLEQRINAIYDSAKTEIASALDKALGTLAAAQAAGLDTARQEMAAAQQRSIGQIRQQTRSGRLADGSLDLKVRSIEVVNRSGNSAARIDMSAKGEGRLTLFDAGKAARVVIDGDDRDPGMSIFDREKNQLVYFGLATKTGNPLFQFKRADGTTAHELGFFTDTAAPYYIIRDDKKGPHYVELGVSGREGYVFSGKLSRETGRSRSAGVISNSQGGFFFAANRWDKRVVLIGPERTGHHGLLNLADRVGNWTRSLAAE